LRSEIFAVKSAPVQVQMIGYPGSSGSNYIQYLIADEQVISNLTETQDLYTEKFVFMPKTHFFAPHREEYGDILAGVDSPKFPGKGESFSFCSMNQLFKIDEDLFKTWMDILKKVPDSILYLKDKPLQGTTNLELQAKKHGVDKSRVKFLEKTPDAASYIVRMRETCHLFLETAKYSSHATGADALFAGVPLLTLPQQTYASRAGLSLLHALDCPNIYASLIAHNLTQYEHNAIKLASDKEKYDELKKSFETCVKNGSLFDAKQWVYDLEKAYKAMWENSQREKISHIWVEKNTV